MAIQDLLDKLRNVSVQDYLPNQETFNKLKNINVQDYVPNVFGITDPGVEGLLGAEQSKALQGRSNIAGLLGAASALSQGMSRTGPRRSALQNILGAAAGGYQSSQGAYQQGLQTFSQQQQLAQQMREREQAALTRQSIEQVMQMPEVANNPALVASLRANPADTLKWINENMAVSKAYEPMPTRLAPAQQMQEGEPQLIDGEKALPPVSVMGAQSALQQQKDRLLLANQRLTGLPGKTAQEAIKNNIDQIAALDKQLMQENVTNFDFNSLKNNVIPELTPQINNLQMLAETGQLSVQDLQKGLQEIQKVDFDLKTKQRDYTNEVTRVAAGMFPNKPLNSLTPEQLNKLQNRLDQLDILKRQAGATTINMPSESERTAGFLTNRIVNSLGQLQAVTGKDATASIPNLKAEAIKFFTGSDYLKNIANPETRQQAETAQLEILDAALTLGTGAAYTREQLQNYARSYFPQLGDKPETIKDKKARLESLLDSAVIKSGRAAPSTKTQSLQEFDLNAIEEELKRRKGK